MEGSCAQQALSTGEKKRKARQEDEQFGLLSPHPSLRVKKEAPVSMQFQNLLGSSGKRSAV